MLLTLITSITVFFASADAPAVTGFQAGIRLLQEEKNEEAFKLFEQDYVNGQESPAMLYNWGHSALRLQKKGYALALWRRALYLDPDFGLARSAIEYLAKALGFPNEVTNLSLLQKIQINLLDRISINKFFFICWLTLVPSFFLLARYLGRRKNALRTEQQLPPQPSLAIFFLAIFVASLLLTILKSVSLLEVRATVVSTGAPLKTGPHADDNTISDVREGETLVIKQTQSQWALVTIESGATGWLPVENIFQHTGHRRLW